MQNEIIMEGFEWLPWLTPPMFSSGHITAKTTSVVDLTSNPLNQSYVCAGYQCYQDYPVGSNSYTTAATRAFRSGTNGYVTLPLPPPATPTDRSEAGGNGVNQSGMVVGWSANTTPSTYQTATIWSGSSNALTIIGVLAGQPSNTNSEAMAVNDSSKVVGESGNLPFLWQSGAMTQLPLPTGSHGCAYTINSQGDIAGEVDSLGAVWWYNNNGTYGQPQALLPVSTSTWYSLDCAYGISDRDSQGKVKIVGFGSYGTSMSYSNRGFIWQQP